MSPGQNRHSPMPDRAMVTGHFGQPKIPGQSRPGKWNAVRPKRARTEKAIPGQNRHTLAATGKATSGALPRPKCEQQARCFEGRRPKSESRPGRFPNFPTKPDNALLLFNQGNTEFQARNNGPKARRWRQWPLFTHCALALLRRCPACVRRIVLSRARGPEYPGHLDISSETPTPQTGAYY